ncbi:7-carboxy-7-deazaguanine synthase QueE [Chamaesiphon minutus]|uniref:7-carboxy-7-deazaguanine synthase n=1 Tax=Chamaesiphon minutus (strain ATCC 27169 / PCC 6605) TaxID=1173020 RepID=K9UJE6_CHAP6|nr:7-carboxy-7-deazaguanine synthase QueE [Chamaesiphon minutus]AFY95227.1 organic radical activating enzyme [Chamaesiphon minutus PCC 6605]
MTALTANLIEIFSAIQGEGINVGTRQIFVRFGGCDLRCHYCDSQHTWQKQPTCQIEQTPGKRDFVTYDNPIEMSQLLEWVERQNQPHLHDSISITGGEPLLHSLFLAQFLPRVKELTHLPIYLETGGHRPSQLVQVLPYLDLVGMDIKLPSVSGETHWEKHAEFLRSSRDAGVDIFVKIIISQTTNPEELRQAARLVAEVNSQIVIFLQPMTALAQPHTNPTLTAPNPEQVLAWQALMKEYLPHIRVIPQTHKMIGQL